MCMTSAKCTLSTSLIYLKKGNLFQLCATTKGPSFLRQYCLTAEQVSREQTKKESFKPSTRSEIRTNFLENLFRPIKRRSFNLVCALDLSSERWQTTLFQMIFFFKVHDLVKKEKERKKGKKDDLS